MTRYAGDDAAQVASAVRELTRALNSGLIAIETQLRWLRECVDAFREEVAGRD